jgi:hypothetical protein
MTEGEFTYLVIKTITTGFDEYLKTYQDFIVASYDTYIIDFYDTSSVSLGTIKDAGDISLTDAIADPDNGIPSDMYETFKLGLKLGIITESDIEDWNTAITKTDAINTLLDGIAYFMTTSYSTINNYSITSSTIQTYATRQEAMEKYTTYDPTIPFGQAIGDASAQAAVINEYGSTQAWNNIAKENGADYVDGFYWVYLNGSGAGDNPSYMVYMQEGSPYYGQTFQYGDTLLDGSINTNGTNDEYQAWTNKQLAETLREQGYTVEVDDDGTYTIIVD